MPIRRAVLVRLAATVIVAAAAWAVGALHQMGFLDLTLGEPFVVRASSRWFAGPAGPVAFVDVTVVPMDRERVLDRQTVVVRGGLIQALGPFDAVPIPDDALVIDGRDRYLMPGLVDMHVHIEDPNELLLFAANGVTTVRNMWGNQGFKRLLGFPDQLELRDRISRGELVGPTIYTSGPILEGPPATVPFMTILRTPADAERAVARQAERGYDFIKVYDNLTPDVYAAVVAASRRHGLPVAGHVPVRVGLESVLESGQRTIEHLGGYLDPDAAELLVDRDSLPDAARRTAAAGVWNVPTFVLWLKRLPGDSDLTRPELRYVSPRMKRIWRTFARQMHASIGYAGDDYTERMRGLMMEVTGQLHAAGAGLLLGTDTDNAYVIPGFSVHEELALLVEAGLSPYEALRSATANAAEAMGRPGEFGVVAVGARGDLLLLEDDPLTDVSHAERRVGVMLQGRWYAEADLQRLLEELAASY
jgi:imidazolonepropionase-like amidohydrolase